METRHDVLRPTPREPRNNGHEWAINEEQVVLPLPAPMFNSKNRDLLNPARRRTSPEAQEHPPWGAGLNTIVPRTILSNTGSVLRTGGTYSLFPPTARPILFASLPFIVNLPRDKLSTAR